MKTYLYIIFDRIGKRLGTIEFVKREAFPSHKEIWSAINETFKNADTYILHKEA